MRSLEFQCTVIVSLAPSQNDRGDVEWHYWRTQKQGSAEAVPVGSKRVVISLILIYIIPQYLIFVKYIKNCIYLYDKLTGERSFSVHLVAASLPIIVIY
jgi:hypothetical protein